MQSLSTLSKQVDSLQVMDEVRMMTGAAVEPTQQLMAAGLDSRGAMELRRALGEQFVGIYEL